MATHTTLSSLLTAIADAIRAKTGKTETIVADNFPAEIAAIETGGGGGFETCQVSLTDGRSGTSVPIAYTNEYGEVVDSTVKTPITITVAKNTVVYMPAFVYPSYSGGVKPIDEYAWYATADGAVYDAG